MNTTSAFVESVIDAIQVWNRQDDKEPTYHDDINTAAVNRFVYEDLKHSE